MEYVMLVIAALLLAVDFSLNNVYQKVKGVSPKASLGFNSLAGLFTALVFFGINGFGLNLSPYSLILSAVINVLLIGYSFLGFRLMRYGNMATYTLFLMSGGMTVPYIWGILFLGEPPVFSRIIALVLVLSGITISNVEKEKKCTAQILMCIAVFVLNGFVSVISKVHQAEPVLKTVSAMDFVIIGGILKFVFAGILYLFMPRQDNNTEKNENKDVRWGIPLLIIILSAIAGGVSYLLQLYGASSLPATVMYPFVTGGSVVFSAILSAVIFKEKLSKKLIASVILCFAGTILFL